MRREDEDWGERRPARRRGTSERRTVRKPYNDDYKEDRYRDYEDDDYEYERRRDYDDYEDASYRGRRRSYEEEPDSRYRSGSRSYREDEYERRDRRSSDRGTRRSGEGTGRRRSYEEDRRRAEYSDGPRNRAPRKRKKKIRGLGCLIPLLILLFLLLAVIVLAGSLWSKIDSANFGASDIAVNSDLPDSVKESTRNYRTIMIFGVDSRDNSTLQAGTLADSNIIASINKKTGEVKLLSIYRDTYVETTDGEHMKLTEVYNKYGAKEQLQTINKNFDMNVTEYVTVNWKAVAQTIDELGGLDIELSAGEAEGINKYMDEVSKSTGIDSEHIEESEGEHHLDGVQAVTYCRLRKGLGDDYKRTERQRTIISLTLSKAKKAGIPKVLRVCNEIFPGISTSLSLLDTMSLALGMGKFDIADSSGFPFNSASQDGGRYYIFPVTLASNAKELHEYLYNNTEYEPSGTVQNLSDAVASFSGYYGN